ncbi:phosphatase PAP2 family protein [Streptomyces sp. NPDC008150]|uniref:phosphatase PAP2 family protein n=1 Tax=Streptomyces sp. NPDC008150 TaxID=3364816 RepID=UPI0036E1CF3A
MTPAFLAAPPDGPAYTDVVHMASQAPDWLDDAIAVWSAYGLLVFAVLMVLGWWRARRTGSRAALVALAVPVIVVLSYAVDSVLKSIAHENRPCQGAHVATLEACPAAGDWSFPSNHATIAAASAVALFFVSRGLGLIATAAALMMAASRVWVGVHYPHDVVAGLLVGALVAAGAVALLRRRLDTLAPRMETTPLRRLLLR